MRFQATALKGATIWLVYGLFLGEMQEKREPLCVRITPTAGDLFYWGLGIIKRYRRDKLIIKSWS